MRALILTYLFAVCSHAMGSEASILPILTEHVEELFNVFEDDFELDDEDNIVSVTIARNSTHHHSDEDIEYVVNAFSSKISEKATLVSQGAKNLTHKISLTFSDSFNPLDKDEVELSLRTNIEVVALEKIKVKKQKMITTKYERSGFRESYFIRDSFTTVFVTASVISGLGAVGTLMNSTHLKEKSKVELDVEKKKKLKDDAQSYEKLSYALAGTAVISGFLGYLLHPSKDAKTYYSYDLVSTPNDSGFNSYALNIKLDF